MVFRQSLRRCGDRIIDRVAMAIWDAEAAGGLTCEHAGPADFYDATVARGAYPGSIRDSRRIARLALLFFFQRRRPVDPLVLEDMDEF